MPIFAVSVAGGPQFEIWGTYTSCKSKLTNNVVESVNQFWFQWIFLKYKRMSSSISFIGLTVCRDCFSLVKTIFSICLRQSWPNVHETRHSNLVKSNKLSKYLIPMTIFNTTGVRDKRDVREYYWWNVMYAICPRQHSARKIQYV